MGMMTSWWGRFLVSRGVMLGALAIIVLAGAYNWIAMFLLVMLIGIDHPPTANDRAHIGWGRRILGLASLLIPLLCMTTNPLSGN